VAASARPPEDLYGLPLDEFTPARDALAKELKADGRKEEAAAVKALRKPTVAAWALNRAARQHPDAVAALRAAGADLRRAQTEALSGDAGRLRAAGRALSDEVDRVAGLAADALRAAGRPASAAQQEKIVATLRTAAVDDDAGDVLTRGVLVDDLDPTGFSLLGGGAGDRSAGDRSAGAGRTGDGAGGAAVRTVPAGGRHAAGADDGAEPGGDGGVATLPGAHRAPRKPKPSKEAQEAVEEARREVRRCEAEADLAVTRAHRRAERAETAQRRAAEAQREADEARAAAEEAAGEAEAARRRAAEAADRLAAAEAALET